MEQTPKAYLEDLDEQVNLDRKVLGKKPFDRSEDQKGGHSDDGNDDDNKGGKSSGAGTTKRMESTTDPESGQQSRDGKPDGFHNASARV